MSFNEDPSFLSSELPLSTLQSLEMRLFVAGMPFHQTVLSRRCSCVSSWNCKADNVQVTMAVD